MSSGARYVSAARATFVRSRHPRQKMSSGARDICTLESGNEVVDTYVRGVQVNVAEL